MSAFKFDIPEWIDGIDAEEGYEARVEGPDDDFPQGRIPKSKLGTKRWTQREIAERGKQLCDLDIDAFENSDLGTLYEHLADLDEVLRHLHDDWPIKRYHVGDQVIRARVLSFEQVAAQQPQVFLSTRMLQRHDYIRSITNRRPLDRKLSMNDLPTEIVERIIDHCEDHSNIVDHPNYIVTDYIVDEKELNTIKALRLTCHKLNELSTRRLIPSITISPTIESLTRLEEVSRHEIFSKSVKRVQLVMGHYSQIHAEDPVMFANYALTTLFWGISAREPEGLGITPVVDILSAQENDRLLSLFDRIHKIISTPEVGEFASREQAIRAAAAEMRRETVLWEAYSFYRLKYQEYQGLMNGDHFVRRVAEAFARLPKARRLDVYDYNHEANDWRDKYVDSGGAMSYQSLMELLTTPMEWDRLAGTLSGPNPSVDALGKLLSALGKLGVHLKVLYMDITPPNDFKGLFPEEPEAREHARELMRDLEFLRLWTLPRRPMFALEDVDSGSFHMWPVRSDAMVESLDGFLGILLSSKKLEWLQLAFESLAFEARMRGAEYYVLPAVMKCREVCRPWRMDLQDIGLDSGKMDTFLGNTPFVLALQRPHMCRGTWMEALSIMRQKSNPDDVKEMRPPLGLPPDNYKVKGLLVRLFIFPNGAECNVISTEMGEYEKVFGAAGPDRRGEDGQAMDYMHHKRDDNPLSGYS